MPRRHELSRHRIEDGGNSPADIIERIERVRRADSTREVTQSRQDESPFDIYDAAWIVGAATGAFCPEVSA